MVRMYSAILRSIASGLVLGLLALQAGPLAFGQGDLPTGRDASLPHFGQVLDEMVDRPCAPDFVVQAFPYAHTANLTGAGNDCPLLSGEDHLYEIHIAQEGLYTFSLCNSPSSINSYIYLTTECCAGQVLASNNNGCDVFGRSEISCQRLNPGVYYLDVEPRSAGMEDAYTLDIFTCPDPCPTVYPVDTTLDNGDGSFTWIQRTDENDQSPLYEGPWFDPTMPPGRDPYYGFEHYSWFNQDFGWQHVFPEYDMPGGVCIQSAQVYMCAWDVDQQDCSAENPGEPRACELDNIYGDGELLNPEYLQGNNDTWSVTTFDIAPAALLDDGIVHMFIDIDVWNHERYWATTLNYSVLEVTYGMGDICNQPPYAPVGYGWPSCIAEADSLCVVITGPIPPDPDSDDVTHLYRWFVRNQFTGGAFVDDENAPPHYINHSGPCIPPGDAEVGDEWRAEVWAVDVHETLSLESLVITFPQIVPVCDDVNPIIGWDYGDLDSLFYPTENELSAGPANAMRASNLAWLGPTCTDDWPEPRCVDQDTDDGVVFVDEVWPGCSEVCVEITVTTGPGYTGQQLYLNAWKDGDFDYSFDDTLCDGTAPECIIRNEAITGLGPNESVVLPFCFEDPAFPAGAGQILRFRLTYDSVGCDGYVGVDSILGETEDYMTDFPLNIELLGVTVTPEEDQITLRWETASEQDNDMFEIERRTSGSIWRKVGSVPGAGTAGESHSYTYVDSHVTQSTFYFYRLITVDISGTRVVVFESKTPVVLVPPVVVTYRLYANWPNPFNAMTSITYDLEEDGPVLLRVFDVLGREAAVLAHGSQQAGRHTVTFDGSSLSSGIYFYRLDAGGFTDTKKMILMK
jgi:hypothetical protein